MNASERDIGSDIRMTFQIYSVKLLFNYCNALFLKKIDIEQLKAQMLSWPACQKRIGF